MGERLTGAALFVAGGPLRALSHVAGAPRHDRKSAAASCHAGVSRGIVSNRLDGNCADAFSPALKPLLLMADSQMLFWKEQEERFLVRVLRNAGVDPHHAKAAYLGASNGDAPEFFELFQAAFADLGLSRCMHVHADPNAAERTFLSEADVILLAGGNVEQGNRAFEAAELLAPLRTRWTEGALLIGVSAGAIQIGASATREERTGLSLVPYVIDVHEEPEWQRLSASIERSGGAAVGMGIPKAGAALIHPDMSVEPIRKPVTEVTLREGVLSRRDLLSMDQPSQPAPDPRQSDWTIN